MFDCVLLAPTRILACRRYLQCGQSAQGVEDESEDDELLAEELLSADPEVAEVEELPPRWSVL